MFVTFLTLPNSVILCIRLSLYYLNRNPEEKKRPQDVKSPGTSAASGRSRRKADEDEDDLDAPVEGRVKICSKSLVFVPNGRENLKRPLIKFMLSDFHDDIQG